MTLITTALLATSGSAQAAPTAHPRPPLIAFLGDSWTVGVGATRGEGYAPHTAARLGWRYLGGFGVSGSGYTRPGPYNNVFSQRVDRIAAADPDVIVVEGSLNDRDSNPATLQATAYDTLHELQGKTDAQIVVLGAVCNPGTPTATIGWINQAVGTAAGRLGLPFINPAHWLDPHDRTLWWNILHPNDKGHQRVAALLAPALRAALLH